MAQLNAIVDEKMYENYRIACKVIGRTVTSDIAIHMEEVVELTMKNKPEKFAAVALEFRKKKNGEKLAK